MRKARQVQRQRRRKPYSLRNRLLFFCLIITLALVAVFFWVQGRTRASVVTVNEAYHTALLLQAAEIIDANLEHYQKLSSVFSSTPSIRYYAGQIVSNRSMFEVGAQWVQREILRYQSKTMFRNIYVYLPDMPIINAFFYEALDEVTPQMQALMDAFERGDRQEGSQYAVTSASPYQLSIINPLYYQGRFVGMMRLEPEMDMLLSLLAELEQGDSSRVLLLDGDTILFSTKPEEIMTPLLRANGATVSQTLKTTGWRFVATLPQDKIQQVIGTLTLTFIIMICLVMAIVVAYFLLTYSTMMRPVRDITEGLQQVGEGDLKAELPESHVQEYRIFVYSFNHMVERIKHLLDTLYYQQVYLRKAQIGEMQSKFNPHFLYNTLDMIYWQLVERGDDDTAETVVALSEILRYSITANHEFTTLMEERRQIENYLLLQGKRLGEHFEWEIQFDDDILALKIPCLLLQPLVENAVNHAFKNGKPYRHIGVLGRREGDRLLLAVVDNGVGMTQEKVRRILENDPGRDEGSGSKLGISLVHKRLQYIYGDAYGFAIETAPGKGVAVRISLECSEDAEKYMAPPGGTPRREEAEFPHAPPGY